MWFCCGRANVDIIYDDSTVFEVYVLLNINLLFIDQKNETQWNRR